MKHIGYILDRFPSRTESFILRELEELYRRGVAIRIFALGKAHLPNQGQCPEYLTNITLHSPHFLSLSVVTAQLFFLIRYTKIYIETLGFVIAKNISKPRYLISALKHFPSAIYFASHMKRMGVRHIHAHFANHPTTVALIAAKVLRVSFSFTAHAWDLYVSRMMFHEKLQLAKFVITCNEFNRDYMITTMGGTFSGKIYRIYHGLDIDKYCKSSSACETASYYEELLRNRASKFLVLSVGRLEKKKGFAVLLEACRLMRDRGAECLCLIVGGGSEERTLRSMIEEFELGDMVHLLGSLPEAEILHLYARADIFVLPCIETEGGDHDGLPNVLLEALAMEVPTISTPIGGIPELIEQEETGILVGEKDPVGLALAIESLMKDEERRRQLARKGREKVVKQFSIRNNIDPIIDLFQQG